MGHAYNYRCSNCGFEQDFNLGHGFRVHSQPLNDYLEQSRKLFHYKTHSVLQRMAATDHELYLKSGFQVYKCPKCLTLQDKKEVVVYADEKPVYRSEFRCCNCRARLKLTNIHRLRIADCPKCGQRTFKKIKPNILL